jgi:2-polyprenyl-3-methyl-5-hydroxy-6-metoxy-1,4-benzoquinol methylase
LIPREGKIYDIGCGYGYTALMLHLVDKNRTIIGIDFDEEKIAVAQNLPSTQGNIQFFVADVRAFDFQKADVFLISDVLHYLKFEEQTALLQKCMNQLSENGMILIRDADSDNEEKHVKSKWTERMSTFFGFNRASFEEMEFISGDFLKSFTKAKGFAMEQYKDSQKTSNTLFVAKRIKH